MSVKGKKEGGRKKNIPLKIQSIVFELCFSTVSETAANYFLLYKNAESLTVSFFFFSPRETEGELTAELVAIIQKKPTKKRIIAYHRCSR